ncbi:MAG: phenylalanine--tRNA ligase subunit beta [Candidatus Theseobacter exili]|nr:phenylalanine--tRNA ligase subunit beta [Candidatus Theseobacter exili]
MKLSYRWLKEFVKINCSPEELMKSLTMSGLEVEGFTELHAVFSGVKVGKVLTCEKHPNADKLSVCEVESGNERFKVVCGASNVRAGLWVPFAPPGAKLPGITIRKAVIRSVESEGMICSEKELGLSDESSGIMELIGEWNSGADFAESMKIEDVIFQVELTPNRGDCCSVLGVAREVAAIFDIPLKGTAAKLDTQTSKAKCAIHLEDSIGCQLYSARIISGVKIGPSPDWLKQRLETIGVRSVNNVVDATNCVMMERGQPLHAFDFDLLQDSTIKVRRAREQEELVCIDDITRKLDDSILVIADAEKPVAVAGVMGGKNTEVTDTTVNILLESAFFNPANVRHSSKSLGLSTEASYRFERRVDPSGVIPSLDYVAEMILSFAGGECSVLEKAYADELEPVQVKLRLDRVNHVLGTDLGKKDVSSILRRLEFLTDENKDSSWNVSIPFYRGDLTREIDLIEEIARMYGYNNISSEVPPLRIIADGEIFSSGRKMINKSKQILFSLGLNEVVAYSFIGKDMIGLDFNSLHKKGDLVEILNPVSEDQCLMRPSLLPGLLQICARNVANGNDTVCCYELGNVFRSENSNTLPEETIFLGIVMTGEDWGSGWHNGRNILDYFCLKGLLSELFMQMNILEWTVEPLEDDNFHPGRSAKIYMNDVAIGKFGEIHPELAKSMKIQKPLLAAELDFQKLASLSGKDPYFQEISRYPSVARDIAVIVDETISHDTIINSIKSAGTDCLDNIELFDVYTGNSIPNNKKSLAYSLLFKSYSGTLTDVEVERAIEHIRESLKQSVKCDFR